MEYYASPLPLHNQNRDDSKNVEQNAKCTERVDLTNHFKVQKNDQNQTKIKPQLWHRNIPPI